MTAALRPYQRDAAMHLSSRDRAMVLAKVGGGKTLIALTAMIMRQDVRKWLVLAPKRVCDEVWYQECQKWQLPITLAVATGTPRNRAYAFDRTDADAVVTNYDNIQTLPDLSDFDGVIFDELTRLKNPSGKRFKDLLKLIDHIPVRWGLTGSFTSNGLEDVFGQCKIVDQTLLGRTKGAFIQQHFITINRDWGQYEPRPGALEAVMEKIKPATYLLENKDYADTLPPLHVVPLTCELPDRKPYEAMKKHYVTEFAGQDITAVNAAAASQKLSQLASGFAYYGADGAAVWHSEHKFDRLEELLAENQRENTIIVYNYKEELAQLKRLYPHIQTMDDKDVVTRWNEGKVPLLALHPKSAGHGLNLQHGGSTLVFLSLPWSLELYEQTIGRLHRSGQTKAVWVYVMMTERTIDERVWQALSDKRGVSDAAIKELRG
jgi:SNF2 family DNA or RNA helicase